MKPTKYLIPLSHNGSGMGPMEFIPCFLSAFAGLDIDVRVCGDSLATRACNRMAADFMYSDCDEMLIIDIDIVFTSKQIRQLLSHDVPLVYGIYPKKQEDTPACLCGFAVDPPVRPIQNSPLTEVRRAGRGFMRVKREVFEAMKEESGGPALRFHSHGRIEWDFFVAGAFSGAESCYPAGARDEDGFPMREYLSEDWVFSQRASALGFKTLVDSTICLGHIGPKEYRFSPTQMAASTQTEVLVNPKHDPARRQFPESYFAEHTKDKFAAEFLAADAGQ